MSPTAVALTLRLQGCTTVPDAIRHACDAVLAGATAAEAKQAIDGWVSLQGQQVQRVFTGPARPDCCTGIEREHLDVPQTADVHRLPARQGGAVNHDMSRSAIECGPDIEEDDAEPGEVCEACDGWGWFTDDADRDFECLRCETTGRVL